MAALDAVVVVPARDEAVRIEACLAALASQTIGREAFEVIVVLDACRDDTGAVASLAGATLGLELTLITGLGLGPGPARRAGMELACERLLASGRPDGLIATTDADSRPAPDWLARQCAHLSGGAQVVAGMIKLDPEEACRLHPAVLAARERDALARLRRLRCTDPDAAHHHFAGASIGVAAGTYRAVGGIEPLRSLEDDGFAERLARHRVPIMRAPDVLVTTSARTGGRVDRGLSVDLSVASWLATRRYRAEQFSVADLLARKGSQHAVVVIPVKECAESVAGVLSTTVGPLREAGLIDDVVVVDAESIDGSAEVAETWGARVVQQDMLCDGIGPALGKGDAMWRALRVCGGDIICFLDGDTRDPSPNHLLGLLGPLLSEPELAMVRGTFARPFEAGEGRLEHEGGRVTEVMARPLINLHEPLLAGFSQPLAGEFAARREVLESLSFPVGYGVEIATLIDTVRSYGLDAVAECDLGTRQNRHQPLRALGEMAYAVLAAVQRRQPAMDLVVSGRYLRPWEQGEPNVFIPTHERPPLRESTPGTGPAPARTQGTSLAAE